MTLEELDELRYIDREITAIVREKTMMWSFCRNLETYEHICSVLDKCIHRAEEQKARLYKALSCIEDEEVKRMIDLRIRGHSWNRINVIVYGYPSRSACRIRVMRALEKVQI